MQRARLTREKGQTSNTPLEVGDETTRLSTASNLVIDVIDRAAIAGASAPLPMSERMKRRSFGTVPIAHIPWHGLCRNSPGWRWGLRSLAPRRPASLTRPRFLPSPLPAPFLHDPIDSAPRQLIPCPRRAAQGRGAHRAQRDGLFEGMTEHLFFTLGKLARRANHHDFTLASAYAVRDRLMTATSRIEAISATPTGWWPISRPEFLNSVRSWATNLLMLGIREAVPRRCQRFGITILSRSWKWRRGRGWGTAARPSGGLLSRIPLQPGRSPKRHGLLASVLLRSFWAHLASLDPLIGWPVEGHDKWLIGRAGPAPAAPDSGLGYVGAFGPPHEVSTAHETGPRAVCAGFPAEHAIGIPTMLPVLGYRQHLQPAALWWRAEATENFDFYASTPADYDGRRAGRR